MLEGLAPRPDQMATLVFHIRQKRTADLSDPGTGKTPPACLILYYWWSSLGARSIWTMPKSLMRKNRDELLAWSGFAPDDVVIYDGTPKQREKMRQTTNAKVWIMGFQRFRDDWKLLKALHTDFNGLAVDEFHMGFSTATSGCSKALFEATDIRRPAFDNFHGMTGTLIKGRLTSAYPMIHVLQPAYYASAKQFEGFHGVKDDFGKIVGWRNHERITQIMGHHAVRHSFESIYGKEAKVIIPELCEMGPTQRRIYDEFETMAMLELEDRFLEAGTGGVQALRCRQIMAHPEEVRLPVAFDETGKPIEWKNYNLLGNEEFTGKDERLLVHLADHAQTGEPLVIFACFKTEQTRVARLCERQGFRVAVMNGDVSAIKRAQIDEDFRAGRIDIIVGTPQVATVGYNWQHCDHVIFASLDYGDDAFVQGYRRFIRGFRTTMLRITLLEYRDSLDQRIFKIVMRKSEDASKVDGRETLDFTQQVVVQKAA